MPPDGPLESARTDFRESLDKYSIVGRSLDTAHGASPCRISRSTAISIIARHARRAPSLTASSPTRHLRLSRVALIADDMREVDAVIARRLDSGVAADRPDSRLHHLRRRQAHPPGAACCCSAGALGFAGRERFEPGGDGRVHPHRDAAARRRRRRIDAAPRPRHRQRDVRQCRQRAGRRLPVFARLPDDGVDADRMRVLEILADATNVIAEGEVLQLMNMHDPDLDVDDYLQRHPLQDRQAVRGQRPPRRRARRGRRRRSRRPAPTTAGRWAPHSSSIDDCSITRRATEQMGKNVGDDLREGKADAALLIAAWSAGRRQQRALVQRRDRDTAKWRRLGRRGPIVRETGALAVDARRGRAPRPTSAMAAARAAAAECRTATALLAIVGFDCSSSA